MTDKKNIPWNLILDLLRGDISEDGRRQLMLWAEDPECLALLERLKRFWRQIQEEALDYTPDKEYYWQRLSAYIRTEKSVRQEPRGRRISLKRIFSYAAACVAAAVLVLAAFHAGTRSVEQPHGVEQYTCVDGKSKLLLPDGSSVWLRGNTTLACGDDFRNGQRCVDVVGEAFFEVAHDAGKPFVVRTDGMQVVVHGTKFNVDAREDRAESRVSLIEGSVELKTPVENVFLRPGEEAVYDRNSRRVAVHFTDTDFEAVWAKERMHIDNMPLDEVCRLLEKWYGVNIHIDVSVRKQYFYTFTLSNEPLEEIVRLMTCIHPISYYFKDKNLLIITAKQK